MNDDCSLRLLDNIWEDAQHGRYRLVTTGATGCSINIDCVRGTALPNNMWSMDRVLDLSKYGGYELIDRDAQSTQAHIGSRNHRASIDEHQGNS
jgi:hypothetical protein